jgi:hypothetical protein
MVGAATGGRIRPRKCGKMRQNNGELRILESEAWLDGQKIIKSRRCSFCVCSDLDLRLHRFECGEGPEEYHIGANSDYAIMVIRCYCTQLLSRCSFVWL